MTPDLLILALSLLFALIPGPLPTIAWRDVWRMAFRRGRCYPKPRG